MRTRSRIPSFPIAYGRSSPITGRTNTIPFNPLVEIGTDILRWFDGRTGVTHASNVVSAWADQSSYNKPVSQAGAAGLRPTYDPALGKIGFDGGDYLFNTDPCMWANGQCMILAVISGPNQTGTGVLTEGRSSNTTPVYTTLWSDQTGASAENATFLRSNGSVSMTSGLNGFGGAVFNTTKKIVTIYDDGEFITEWVNGVMSPNIIPYTRGAEVLTLDRFTIGGLLRTSFASGATFDLWDLVVVKNANYRYELEGHLAYKHGI